MDLRITAPRETDQLRALRLLSNGSLGTCAQAPGLKDSGGQDRGQGRHNMSKRNLLSVILSAICLVTFTGCNADMLDTNGDGTISLQELDADGDGVLTESDLLVALVNAIGNCTDGGSSTSQPAAGGASNSPATNQSTLSVPPLAK
jgi:EF hand domain-containing protein